MEKLAKEQTDFARVAVNAPFRGQEVTGNFSLRVGLLFDMNQLINRNNTNSHHAICKPTVSEH